MKTARRLAYCRSCGDDSQQQMTGLERQTAREVTYWRCCACGYQLLTYADVQDARAFAEVQVERWLDNTGGFTYDREELVAVAEMALWRGYLRWQPSRGVRFRAYATTFVGQRLTDWLRTEQGRGAGKKPHVGAVSIDAHHDDERGHAGEHRLAAAVSRGHSDPAEDRPASLVGVLARRDQQVLRAERVLGLVAAR